jgi:hypothetical protein
MIMGSLLDLGVELGELREMLQHLPFEGWSIDAEAVTVGGMRATKAVVRIPREHEHRHLSDIRDIARGSGLPDCVSERGLAAFTRLAAAEAAAHGMDIEEVHFHEVGAMDAILDIFGVFCCLSLLGVEKVYSSPVRIGSGTVECAHGVMPVPAPATARLLEGVPVVPTSEDGEMVTPTGAALLTEMVDDWGLTGVPGRVLASGLGVGSRKLARANLLRVMLVESDDEVSCADANCVEVRTVVDDMDPRMFPELVERVMEAGAVDCYACHTTGRKGRPGLEITVLAGQGARNRVLEALFRCSTTIGARVSVVPRVELDREIVRLDLMGGAVDVKLARLDGSVVSAEPELECCRRLAEEEGLPLKVVMAEARGAARRKYMSGGHE